MDIGFWAEIQKCWRVMISSEDRQRIRDMADMTALDWGSTTISKPYSSNPLDDLEDEDDEEDY